MLRSLGAKIKQGISITTSANEQLQPIGSNMIQHLKKGDQIALPRSIGPDQHIDVT
jgi:hypothetical protein